MANEVSKTREKWQQLRDGLATVAITTSTLPVEGQSYTQATLLAAIDVVLARYARSAAAQAEFHAAVAALKAVAAADRELYAGVAAVMKQILGSKNPELAKLGLSPKAPPAAQTTETKALAVAKRLATRKLRNVMSKQARAALPRASGLTLQVLGPTESAGSAQPAAPEGANGGDGPKTPSTSG